MLLIVQAIGGIMGITIVVYTTVKILDYVVKKGL